MAQWQQECSSPDRLQEEMSWGWTQISANGPPSFVLRGSDGIRVMTSSCSDTVAHEFLYPAYEQAAYMHALSSSYADLTGDGNYEQILIETYNGSPAYQTAKILDLITGNVLFTTPDTNGVMNYATIQDMDGNGVWDCVVTEMNDVTDNFRIVIYDTGVSAQARSNSRIASSFVLKQNYPNPFNPATRIEYSIAQPGRVTLDVFNINGRKVTSLVNGFQPKGEHSFEWNSTDEHGIPLASGSYLYQVSVNGKPSGARKMILVR